MVVPLRGGTFRMMIVLRGVTLLDGSYTHVSLKVGIEEEKLNKLMTESNHHSINHPS
jgi:hypothetical protein